MYINIDIYIINIGIYHLIVKYMLYISCFQLVSSTLNRDNAGLLKPLDTILLRGCFYFSRGGANK